MKIRQLIALCVACVLALASAKARAQDLHQAAKDLGSPEKVEAAVDSITKSKDPAALSLLQALSDDSLRLDAAGAPFVAGEGSSLSPVFGGGAKPTGVLSTPLVDNRLRRQLEPALASLKLGFPDPKVRLAAAKDLAKSRNDDLAPLIRAVVAKEKEADIRRQLGLALAQIDLNGSDKRLKLAAIAAVTAAADASFQPDLERMVGAAGQKATETDPEVKKAATAALGVIHSRVQLISFIGN